jgi:hypothetical protein
MIRPIRRRCAPVLLAVLAIAVAAPATAQKPDPASKPDKYICPNAVGGAVDCFLDAVSHLYTMCRQVKSIEIIEFGYEKSTEGTNGAKSEYCVDKHRQSIARPYQSALREATGRRAAVDGLRTMYDLWQRALAELKWNPGEDDDQYKARVAKPYAAFSEHASVVRAAMSAGKGAATAAAQAKSKSAN